VDENNAVDLANQMALGRTNYSDRHEPMESTPELLVVLSQGEAKEKGETLKEIFRSHPGEVRVYLKVGEKKIKTNFTVNKNDELKKQIFELLEEDRVN
jgi:hypothetical protein